MVGMANYLLRRVVMPDKATSKRQWRLFKGIAEGSIPEKGSLTKEKAAEMLGEQSPRGLPEKAAKKGLSRLVSRAKRAKSKRWKVG
jgi:hypothetical protein